MNINVAFHKNHLMEVANLIWDIAKISPEHGNALIDIIGEDAYAKVMKLQKEDEDGTED